MCLFSLGSTIFTWWPRTSPGTSLWMSIASTCRHGRRFMGWAVGRFPEAPFPKSSGSIMMSFWTSVKRLEQVLGDPPRLLLAEVPP